MRHLNLFAGIGGASLAAEMVWDDVEHIFCEIDPFCQAVLRKHWPNAKIYGDIRTLKGEEVGPVDIITGGFPCQPFSAAGKRRGTEDDRHLWPEMLRVIRECKPTWVLGENVGGFLTWDGGMVFEQVCTDLEAEGYEVCPFVIPAAAVNAPHRRDRVWIAAYATGFDDRGNARTIPRADEQQTKKRPEEWVAESCGTDKLHASDSDTSRLLGGSEQGKGCERKVCKGCRNDSTFSEPSVNSCNAPNPSNTRLQGRKQERAGHGGLGSGNGGTQRPDWSEDWVTVAARLCTLDDGLPNGLARPRGWRNAALKGAGNAWVPQVAAQIFEAIKISSLTTRI